MQVVKTVNKYREKIKEDNRKQVEKARTIKSLSFDDQESRHGGQNIHIIYNKKNDYKSVYRKFKLQKLLPKPEEELKLQQVKFHKLILNYCSTFNSSFLIVGSLAESYFFGVRMVGNIASVSIGYVYALFLVLPLTTNLDENIKTPYQYFEKRYGNRKYVRAVTATVGMLFYFSFLTLYLWACAILVSTLVPQLPLYWSCILIGVYSTVGSTIGGFTQATRVNVLQFSLVLGGLTLACLFTLKKATLTMNMSKLIALLTDQQRMDFVDERIDLTTRYTILNQFVSLPIPWTSVHALFLPNFMRYRSIRGQSYKRKSLAIISNFPFMVMMNAILLLAGGLLVFLFFFGCDPLYSDKISNKNQTGSYWILLILGEYVPSFTGILFSSIVCYSVVQHSMGIALCANSIYCEIINPLCKPVNRFGASTVKMFRLCLTMALGVISIVYAYGFAQVRNTALSLFFVFNNSTNSPILGLYLLSAFNPYANHAGAMLAFVLNLFINYFVAMGHVNLYSNTPSQQFNQTTAMCDHPQLKHMKNLSLSSSIFSELKNPYNISGAYGPFYPENETIYFLYLIAPIWYCLWSVLFTFIMGSLFSLIYSLIKTKSCDADSNFKEERKKYLFVHKIREKYFT